MAASAPCFVPEPKEWTRQAGQFLLDSATTILLLPTATEETFTSSVMLQNEIEACTGLRVPVLKVSSMPSESGYILLVDDMQACSQYLGQDATWAEGVADHGGQAYGVDISAERVIAGGADAVAAHLAAQTLRQIVRVEGACWTAQQIVDWPSLAYRGLMLDVSRGKVPTLDTLELIVDQLSLFKMNVLQLYTEHTFAFAHHPRIGEDCGSLTSQDIMALDNYARQRHVELMPNLNSFGHCAHVLNMPQYAHLAESSARWSYCPTDERVYTFIGELFDDLLPSFSSTQLNVGCDETYDLGKGRSAQAVAERGTGRVYLEHLLRLHGLAAKRGRTIQIWGDILLHYPELVSELPDDVTLLDWHYGASDDYPSLKVFEESGRRFWVCPGTSSWNTLFPRIENSNVNIKTLARLGAERGAEGMLNTDWGDHGHYQLLGQCWYGYAYGAEQAWTGGSTDDRQFDRRFGEISFGPGGADVVGAMREMARCDTLPGMTQRNGSNSVYGLLDEPLVGAVAQMLPSATLQAIEETCQRAQGVFRAQMSTSRDRLSLEEMVYSSRMMAYMARKVAASQWLAAQVGSKAINGEALSTGVDTLRMLDAQLVDLITDFWRLWMARVRRSEIGISLSHWNGLRSRYAAAINWLEGQAAAIEAGQSGCDLSKYAQDAAGYQVLGQAFVRQMREAGIFD